jgi:hypothetical protein
MTPTSEEWRPVVGYEGLYEVSDHGNVRSVDRTITRITGESATYGGRQLRGSADADGRRRVALSRSSERRTFAISTLVLRAFVGEPLPGMEACHGDGNAANDALGNLRWDTSSENNYDIVRHGRHYSASKEACPRGHRLDCPNLVASLLKRGNRSCLACSRAGANVRHAKRTGRPHDFVAWADDHYQRIMKE